MPLRGRPAGASEGVKADLEGSGPAASDDADGLGEVPEHYPQAPGTRPVSLRQALLIPEATNGHGSSRVWRPCTPAMAAGLTDHAWSLKSQMG